MRSPLILIPTYGKEYKSESEVKKDFDSNEAFILENYPFYGYIDKESCESEGIESVIIKYREADGEEINIKINIEDQAVGEEEMEVFKYFGYGFFEKRLRKVIGYIHGVVGYLRRLVL